MDTRPSLSSALGLFFSVILLSFYALLLVDFFDVPFVSSQEACFYLGALLFLILLLSTFYKAFVSLQTSISQFADNGLLLILIVQIVSVIYLGYNNTGDLPGLWPHLLFWLTIVIWTISWSIRAYYSLQYEDVNMWLATISNFWFFLCVFMTIGTSYYEFAIQPINDIPIEIKFIDLRILVGLIVAVFICCKAIARSFEDRRSFDDIAKIPSLQIPGGSDRFFKIFVKVPILVLNILLAILIFILNLLWRTVALIIFYLVNFLICLAKEIYNQYFRLEYIRMIVAIGLIISLFVVAAKIQVLNDEIRIYFETDEIAPPLTTAAILIGLFISILIGSTIIIHDADIDDYFLAAEEWGEDFAHKVAYIISVMWITGGVLWVINYLQVLNLDKFKHIGLFTILATVFIVGSGVIYSIILGIKGSKNKV